MLPETSNVSMIVPSTRGRATVACGRAIAIANSTRAAMIRTAAARSAVVPPAKPVLAGA